jgi:hypothetical protein
LHGVVFDIFDDAVPKRTRMSTIVRAKLPLSPRARSSKGWIQTTQKREAKRQQVAERQCATLATLIIEEGPYETSLTGRQVVVNWKPAMSALRRGLKDHMDLAIAGLTRRQIMAAVDKVAKTGKRGAAKDLRKHSHTCDVRLCLSVTKNRWPDVGLYQDGQSFGQGSWR